MDNPGLAALGIGAIFVYGGIKGYSPLKAITNIITGKNPNENQSSNILAVDTSVSSGDTSQFMPPANTSGNRGLGQMMAAQRGWSGSEWTALDKLWTKESGWNNKAKNPSSGAYGIPQALPPTKMPFAAQEAGGSNAQAQIGWGLDYIAQQYGSPSAAWAHEVANNWY